MKSIIQKSKECYLCKRKTGLHDHHIYYGTALRKISERNGFKVWLCFDHHLGLYGVHGKHGHEVDIYLKQVCQKEYELNHSRKEFIKLIGKNYRN